MPPAATGRASGCGSSRDKLAISGAIFIVFLFIVAFAGAPIAQHLLGHGPNDINPIPGPGGGITDELLPVGPWT